MAKHPKIRISKNDRKEYKRLVRNAKSKIRRTKKQHGVDLTSEIELPSLKDFSSRSDFNEWKDDVESFTNRYNLKYQFVTNQYGVTASKSQIHHIQERRRREQYHAKEELKRIADKPVYQGGKPFTTIKQRTLHMDEPSVTGVRVPKDFDFSKIRTQRKLEEVEEVGRRREMPDYYDERKELMQHNFLKAIEGSFPDQPKDVKKLIDKLGNLDSNVFYELYLSIEEMDFDDYDSDGQFVESNLEKVRAILNDIKRYEDGKLNIDDLKNF